MESLKKYLEKTNRRITIEYIMLDGINDNEENIKALKAIADSHLCVDKIELLPFRKICQVKYDKMNIPFRFGHLPEPTREKMEELSKILQ